MNRTQHGRAHGIPLKKSYGQHFLRDRSVVDAMIDAVDITPETSVFEIGCGDGFLTRAILETPAKRLWVFEIDAEWADYVQKTSPDDRMTIFKENILDVDFKRFAPGPWVLLANLPYQITFPIFKRLYEHRDLLREGVVMIQEEVAQKITAAPGDTTVQSLFYGHYFELKMLVKIPPTAFYPPPKVYSRLVYFKPRTDLQTIPDEAGFWHFVDLCFLHRRRTLRNNLKQTHFPMALFPERYGNARAQELALDDFLILWDILRSAPH